MKLTSLTSSLVTANLAWLFFVSVLAYYFVYEWFHFAHHLSRDSWLGRRALVGWLRQHHTRHHELALMEKGNFNVSFPLWDWLLGTMLPETDTDRSARFSPSRKKHRPKRSCSRC